MTRFFTEERQPTGNFAPVVYHGERPTEKRAGHTRKFRFTPVEIPPSLYHLTLDQLREALAPDGKLRWAAK